MESFFSSRLWTLCYGRYPQQYDVFAADSTLAEMIKRRRSTLLLWSGEICKNISLIFIPTVKSGNHWTLLVSMLVINESIAFVYLVGI